MGYVLTHIPTVPSLGPCVFRYFSYPFTALLYIIKRLPSPPPQPLWASCPLCSMGGTGRTVGREGARSQGISPFLSLPSTSSIFTVAPHRPVPIRWPSLWGPGTLLLTAGRDFLLTWIHGLLCRRHPGGCALSAQTYISFTIFHSKLIFFKLKKNNLF